MNIKSKGTAFIDFGNGPVEYDVEMQTTIDGEAIPDFAKQIRDIARKLEIPMQLVSDTLPREGIHQPTGPVVDSTLAERDEEGL